jgi:ABC-type branched-subunit amino acid transport system ATPase component/ABC-type branched-subunit amino acid transport system permease subunit
LGLLRYLPFLLFIIPPLVFPSQLELWVNPLMIGIAGAVGINILTGTTGQISLGQAGFLAVGAYTGVAVGVTAGLPFPVALVASIGSGALVGCIMALTTARLRGLYAVISTLALQFVLVFIGTSYESAASTNGPFVLPAAAFGGWTIDSSIRWYIVLAVMAGLYLLLYYRLLRSRAGRALEVIGERDHVAGMLGISVPRYEMYAWVLSGALVSLTGCVYAYNLQGVSPTLFTLTLAIQYFAMIVVGGRGSPMGSVIGAAALITLPYELQDVASRVFGQAVVSRVADYDLIFYGVILVVFLAVAPDGLVGRMRALIEYAWRSALLGRGKSARASAGGPGIAVLTTAGMVANPLPTPPMTEPLEPAPGSVVDPAPEGVRDPIVNEPIEPTVPISELSLTAEVDPGFGPILEVQDVTVGYRGGAIALRRVSLTLNRREVVTVLGANGAGKTTLLRAIAGFTSDEPGFIREGRIFFDGRAESGVPAYRRAESGIVLVPEREKVFATLSVHENLELASPTRRGAKAAMEEVLDFFPALRPKLPNPAVLLSGGERQMLAIARGFMLKPKILLLDETTLGLAPIIAERVMVHIRDVVRASGASVLLVEQNATLARTVSDRYYTLRNGEIVDQGSFADEGSEDFVTQYFGSDEG